MIEPLYSAANSGAQTNRETISLFTTSEICFFLRLNTQNSSACKFELVFLFQIKARNDQTELNRCESGLSSKPTLSQSTVGTVAICNQSQNGRSSRWSTGATVKTNERGR